MESEVRYGQELGPNLIKIAKKLIANQNLCKLLVNTNFEPLNEKVNPEVIEGLSLLHKNVRVVPLLMSDEQSTESKIVVLYTDGSVGANYDNENLSLSVYVYCPFAEWKIAGDSLRPFAIMSEVRKSLQDKRINGLGEITYYGFSLSTLTEEMGCYVMRFSINAFA